MADQTRSEQPESSLRLLKLGARINMAGAVCFVFTFLMLRFALRPFGIPYVAYAVMVVTTVLLLCSGYYLIATGLVLPVWKRLLYAACGLALPLGIIAAGPLGGRAARVLAAHGRPGVVMRWSRERQERRLNA
jgi:hypothetical protein